MDYAKNQKYFEGIDMTWANRLIIAGVVAILFGFGSNFLIAVLGILAVVGGIAWRTSKKKGIVTDAEYDNSVAANLNNMKSRALAKLGIEEELLVPQYQCPHCEDTGFLKSGVACNCYKPEA